MPDKVILFFENEKDKNKKTVTKKKKYTQKRKLNVKNFSSVRQSKS